MLRLSVFLLECTFSGTFLWLGLYLITRDNLWGGQDLPRWWRRPAPCAGLTLLCLAWYLLGYAMQVVSTDSQMAIQWVRMTYCVIPLSIPPFFWAALLIGTPPGANVSRAGRGIFGLLILLAVALSLIAALTNRFFLIEALPAVLVWPEYQDIPPRYPDYWLFIAYILAGILAVIAAIAKPYRSASPAVQAQLRWMAASLAVLWLGALIGFAIVSTAQIVWLPAQISDTTLVAGVFLLGYGIARHNALLRHRVITRDFFRSLAGAIVTSVVFLLVVGGVHLVTPSTLSPETLPLLIWLAILVTTLSPWLGGRLDEVFLPAPTAAIRRTLERASEQLATASDEQEALRALEAEVPRAITATLADLKLQEMRATIGRDINDLFRGTNYARHSGEQYVAIATDLLKLAVVEERTEALMAADGVATTLDRQPYQLKAFEQIIDGLVAQMETEAAAMKGVHEDINSYRRQRKEAQATILRMQFLRGIPRERVQAHIETKLQVGKGGSYGRFLTAAKSDLAERVYLAELRALSAREDRLSA